MVLNRSRPRLFAFIRVASTCTSAMTEVMTISEAEALGYKFPFDILNLQRRNKEGHLSDYQLVPCSHGKEKAYFCQQWCGY
ncbi:hypothetical protein WOLCODRAFT_27546 [Wolfiporia cocos MD-104 SS10]|uniref:Uncharacterized protein n=1 Tax=Wolfiporia cocos (strain MD-104) TaxID=742152 RepID=A0A2H3J889_WOLCO|nr:hypothetical protein WOLCODRAFT_27546 [Wolfiporia cocos MD-104 SS10]